MPVGDSSRVPSRTGTPADTVAFVALTFAIALAAYLPVIADARGWVAVPDPLVALLPVVGVFSPAIAALVLRARAAGRDGVRAFFGGLAEGGFPARWWAVTLLLPPVSFAVMYGAFLALGGEFVLAERARMLLDAGWTVVFVAPIMALVIVSVSFGEEAGWRGYLLPLLQSRMGALSASLVLGVVWFAWHVPLTLLPGDANAAFPLHLWAVSIVASSVVYTWLFNSTGGSVLAATLLHAGYNFWGPMLALHPSQTGSYRSVFVIVGFDVVLAVALVLAFGAATLRGRQRVGTEPSLPVDN